MSQPFWSNRVAPTSLSSAYLPVQILGRLARWAVLGTMASVAFGVGLGLVLGIPRGTVDIAIGGAAVGLAGGPVFGVIVGLIHASRRRSRRERRIEVGTYAKVGAVVFAMVPFAIGLARGQGLIGPNDLSEVILDELFFAATGAALGAIVGAALGDGKVD